MIINKFNFDFSGLNLPGTCPVCGGDLEILENGQVKCINPNCRQKVAHKIEKCLDKLGVKGAGPAFYEKASEDCKRGLYDFLAKVVEDNETDFNKWAGGINGKKILNKVQKALTKPISIAKYISIFDIEGVGEGQIEKITKAFPERTLGDFVNPVKKEAFLCEGIKETLAEKIFQGIRENRDALDNCGIFFKIIDPMFSGESVKAPATNGKLSGLSFVFTGAMELKRSDLEKMVKENGGEVASGVSVKLSYLVQADPSSTSSKSVKAKKLGIKIITPNQFLDMLK